MEEYVTETAKIKANMQKQHNNNIFRVRTTSSLSEPRSLGDENAIVEAVEVAAIKKIRNIKAE